MNLSFVSYLALGLWLLLTSSSFVVSEALVPYASPVASTGLRFILAGAILFPFVAKGLTTISVELLLRYAAISGCLVLFFLGLFKSLETTTAARTSVIYTLLPLLTVAVSSIALRAKPMAISVLGFVLGSLGAVWVLLTLNTAAVDWGRWYFGDSLFFLSCVCLSIHVVLIKRWLTHQPPMQSTLMILLMGSLLMSPILLTQGELDQVQWQYQEFWVAFLYLTCCTTLGTFLLQQYLLKRFSPNHLLAVSYLTPLCILLPGAWLDGFRLYYGLPGVVLTLVAMPLIFRTPPASAR
ncbi:MAG: DMT family transporter [Cellvibrionaceae bacterium]